MDMKSQRKGPEYHRPFPEQAKEAPAHPHGTLLHWEGAEFEPQEKSRRWYLIVIILLFAMVIYAIFKNEPIVAITFIMIGVTGYLMLTKEPRLLDFRITQEGLAAGPDLFPFENIHSFWIFYEPPHEKILSLRLKHSLLPFIHIPLHDQDPVKVREILLRYIPETKQEKTLVDTVERILGI